MTRYLIFDLDGTLIDSSEGVVEATNYALVQTGQPERPAEEIKPFIGFPLEDMFTAFTTVPYDQLWPHFQARAKETVVGSTSPLPYVDETLARLHQQGFRMAIATTKIKVHVDLIIEKCRWGNRFQATVGGDEVARVKPAPDAFQLALERLGADRSNSLVIGDTINDVLAAKAIDLPVVAIHSPYGGNDDLEASKPTYSIPSVRELPAVVDQHFSGSGGE